MLNPFDESDQVSIQEFNSSLPVCFAELTDCDPPKCRGSELSSPIAIIDLDRLSEKFSNEANEQQLRSNLKQAQLMLREVKTYTESLEHRNLQMVIQLQKEKMRSKQLLNTLTFLKHSQQERNQADEQKSQHNNDLSSRYLQQKNRNDLLENQTKTIKLQNGYLKELILIANQNYEKLEHKNRELVENYSRLEEEKIKKEAEMLVKTDEIKNMFAAIVIEKNTVDRYEKVQRREELNNTNNSINFNSVKSVRKQPVEDAYRQIFMKTLKPKKENRQ